MKRSDRVPVGRRRRLWVFATLIAATTVGALATQGCKKIPPLTGDDSFLAHVGKFPISRYDVDLAIRTSFGPGSPVSGDEKVRKNVLESLVQTRAIGGAEEQELDAKERQEIDKQVAAFREQLLVKRYLIKHAPPQPVSDAMIEEYYVAHADKFGAASVRAYELVGAERALTLKERDLLVTKLGDAQHEKDWKSWQLALKQHGEPILYREGDLADEGRVLHARLADLMNGMKSGQTSAVTFVEGRPYVVRITGDTKKPPRPLAQVRDEIREMLAPVRVRESVKKAADEVLKTVRVSYP